MMKSKKDKLQLASVAEAEIYEDAGKGLFWDSRPPRDHRPATGMTMVVARPLSFADLQSMIESNKDEIELVMN